MELLWMLLLLVLLPSQAQRVEEVRAELGQDVTLTCSISSPELHWVMEVHSRIRAGIGRTYSSLPTYFSPDLEAKYSLSGNWLMVRNLSVEDSRLYFCGRKEGGRTVYGEPISLMVSDQLVTVSSPTKSSTADVPIGLKESERELLSVMSLTLNGVLLVVVLGLIGACMKRNSYCCCCRAKDSAEYSLDHQEMQNPQNKIIQLPPTRVSSECIYSYKAQHPGPMLPHY